ncbi:LysM peptidoglycan-binding domain-containing protein [Roseibium sp.]|uniref:LysM peptidoglycan-binding domain-containing protein n=1 Tax=Roseibium sp. TaxID=1936156 RepID=UPI003A969041
MTKLAVIRATAVAVVVGVAALVTGYLYKSGEELPPVETAGGQQQPAPGEQSAPADAGTSEESAATVTRTETASETQQETAQADVAPEDGGPSFDVVGVEPTGDTVVAGRADAGSIVALTANGKVVGKTIANEKGEWTIILDQPLSAGDYDVALQVQDEDGSVKQESRQRLAVSIPEGGKEQPLVVLNTPDAASTLLQKPDLAGSVSEGETQVAAADQQSGDAPAAASEEVAATAEAVANAATEAEATARKSLEDSLKSAAEAASSAEDAAASAADAAADAVSKTAQALAGDGKATETTVAAAEDATSGTPASSTPASSESASASDAGTSVGAAPVSGEADADASGQETAAAAASEPATTSEQPASTAAAAETTTAEASTQAPAAEATSADTETAQAGESAVEPVVELPQITVEAVEAEAGKVYAAGTGAPGTRVNIYVGDKLLGTTEVGGNGRWLIDGEMALAAGSVEVRADMVAAGGEVASRAAVTFEKEEEAIVLTKVTASAKGTSTDGATGASVEKPLPNVIIRKGDNLWRISRRLYGDGFRYTTIYQANKGQIRNPDLIYPGQVFLTPEGDLSWQPAQN